MSHVGAGRGLAERARLGVKFVGDGRRAANEMIENHWLATNELAARLGLGADVREGLYQTFERWDGKGVPAEVKGERDPGARAPGEPRRRRRGLPPERRGGRGGRGRSRTQRHPVRPGAGGRLLFRGADAVQRDRLGDDVAGGDRSGAGARGRALRRRARVRAGGDRRLHRPEIAVDDRPLARRGRPRMRGHEDLRAVRRGCQARAQGGAGARSRSLGRLQRDLGQARDARPRRSSNGCACIRT